MVYSSTEELAAAALTFARTGLEADEEVVVCLSGDGNRLVAAELAGDAARFVDPLGRDTNPARAMAQLLVIAASTDRQVRYVGDLGWTNVPWGQASVAAEAVLADALLDTLGGAGRPMNLFCGIPSELAEVPGVLACHDGLRAAVGWQPNAGYDAGTAAALFALPLPEPGAPVSVYCSNGRPLAALREFVAEHARAAHVSQARADDLVLAAHEVATNSLRHAGSEPIVRMWRDAAAGSVVCEIHDHGLIADPMAGRLLPETEREDGRGLWLANQLCDLAQVRSSALDGTTVRLHVRAA